MIEGSAVWLPGSRTMREDWGMNRGNAGKPGDELWKHRDTVMRRRGKTEK